MASNIAASSRSPRQHVLPPPGPPYPNVSSAPTWSGTCPGSNDQFCTRIDQVHLIEVGDEPH
jgi:hypothetical protein